MFRIRRFSSDVRSKFHDEISSFLNNRKTAVSSELSDLRKGLKSPKLNEKQLNNFILNGFLGSTPSDRSHVFIKKFIDSMRSWNETPSLSNYDILIRSYLNQANLNESDRAELSMMYEVHHSLDPERLKRFCFTSRCQKLLKDPNDILPSTVFKSVITGLCRTDDWRNSIDYIERIRDFAVSNDIYHTVAHRAFKELDFDLGFNCLRGSVYKGETEIFNTYWASCMRDPSTALENLERMLAFIGEREILLQSSCIKSLLNVFNGFGVVGKEVKIRSEYELG